MTIKRLLTGVALSLSLLGATTASASVDPERERALGMALAESVVQPVYQRFATNSEALAKDLRAYCSGADAGAIDDSRETYRRALHDWMFLQAINWGPAAERNRHPSLYFWPDKKDIGSRQLRALIADADPATLKPAYFDNASIAVSGLSALERLLFADKAPEPGSYRCDLAAAIAGNSQRIAVELAREWPDFVEEWRLALDPRGSIKLMLKSMDEIAQIVSQQKIGMPLGSNPDHARARRAESWRSGQSLDNIGANLDFIAALLHGTDGQAGMMPLIAEQDSDLAEVLEAQLLTTEEMLHGLGQPLESAVEDPSARHRLMMLQANVDALQTLLAGDVSGALGITLGFNSRDGD
ncbi:MAG: imelysin family protein [Oceanospirillaceae bacterium]|nr:imelysin family protein [Oceanospirillaceae bacterium]